MSATEHWGSPILDRLQDFIDESFGEEFRLIDEKMLEPGWQLKATINAFAPMYSTVQLPRDGKLEMNASFIGGLLGHLASHMDGLSGPVFWGALTDACKILASASAPEARPALEGIARGQNPFPEIRAKLQEQILEALCCVLAQSDKEQADFFAAYSKALRCGSITEDGKGVAETTRTPAYKLIAILGPSMKEQWRTISDVHKLLVRLLGRERAGDLKRTEKICAFLGLKLGPSGRPPKSRTK